MSKCTLNEDIHQYPIRPKNSVSKIIFNKNIYTGVTQPVSEFLKTYFDKIYCINLNKRLYKWESVELRLRQKGINAFRFEAIDGELFGISPDMSRAELGCLCSHLEVIKNAKLNNYKRILIFEDDVHLSKNFEERILSIKDISWKLLYLGASQYNWQNIDTSEEFYPSKETFGTFAYAIDESLFDELIVLFSRKKYQVDKCLAKMQEKYYGQCLTIYPNIAIADVRASDIRESRDIHTHSNKVKWDLSLFSAFDKETKKVLLLPDTRGWAFDNIARAIVKYNPRQEKIYYDILYTQDIHSGKISIDTNKWDYVYIMFEGEESIPPARNIIRGCYSARWLECNVITPEYMSKYFSKCGGAIFVNQLISDEFINILPKNFPTSVIYDASDEAIFYPIKYKKNKEFTVMFVGNTHRPIKNFNKIQKICEASGVKLHVCKNIPNKEMVHEYNKVDLVINYSDFEGGPQTFVEASLCEVPMLIRDTIHLSKLIPCFVGKDEEDFIKILMHLKNNRQECEKKGNEAYNAAIQNFTYKTVSKKFTDFLIYLNDKDFTNELTVFVISAGDNPNFQDCLDALSRQTCKFELKLIKNIAPMSRAFQEMINLCKTPYYVQVDEDMILEDSSIETMYESIKKSKEKTFMISYMLKDVHLDFNIVGIKIYKHHIMKQYPYNLDVISCEKEQILRLEQGGYVFESKGMVVGLHSPKWTTELIYERYFDLMEKYKVYGYSWLEHLPKKLCNKIKESPTEENIYAFLGAIMSVSTGEKLRDREKNYLIQDSRYENIKTYLNKIL